MKHLILLVSLLTNTLMAQEASQSPHRVVVGAGVGVGFTYWGAEVLGGELYKGGGVNLPISIDAFYQYKQLRVGVGVSFEKLFIDSLQDESLIYPGIQFKHNQVTFKKFYAQAEYILINVKGIDFGLSVGAGIYRLDKNFSQNYVDKRFFMLSGIFGEYKFKNKLILNVKPLFELKHHEFEYLIQQRSDTMLSINLMASLRYDIF